MRNWTLENRLKQAILIRNWQPWKHSTGPNTLEGKAISSKNAYKHGSYKLQKELRKLLKQQKKLINAISK